MGRVPQTFHEDSKIAQGFGSCFVPFSLFKRCESLWSLHVSDLAFRTLAPGAP